MNFIRKNDPIFSILHDRLRANILRFPDERIGPLGVIEAPLAMGTPKFIGRLEHLVYPSQVIETLRNKIEIKRSIGLEEIKTNKNDLQVGLELLGGILKRVGVNLSGLKAHFGKTSTVSFHFDRVDMQWLDNGLLSKAIQQSKVQKMPVTNNFFGLIPCRFLVIDAAYISDEFSMIVTSDKRKNIEFDIAAIKKELGTLDAQIERMPSKELKLSFKENKALPFAFTCLHFELGKEGQIVGMPVYEKKIRRLMGDSRREMEKFLLDMDLVELQ